MKSRDIVLQSKDLAQLEQIAPDVRLLRNLKYLRIALGLLHSYSSEETTYSGSLSILVQTLPYLNKLLGFKLVFADANRSTQAPHVPSPTRSVNNVAKDIQTQKKSQ